MIDLTRTIAPSVPKRQPLISNALARIALEPDIGEAIRQHHFHGTAKERDLAAMWIGQRLGPVVAERVLLTGGTQVTLQILFKALAANGRPILSETLSYSPVEHISRWLNLDNIGISIDDKGLIPDALEEACRRYQPALLYCNPTLHNPTVSTMPVDRRRAIAAITERYNVAIVEDDVHGALDKTAPPPLSSFAPERSWYLQTLSKTLGFGLRTAILIAPDPQAAQALIASTPTYSGWFVPTLSAMLIAELMESEDINTIIDDVADEIRDRQKIALSVLGDLPGLQTQPTAMHLWLPLPRILSIDRLVDAAKAEGVNIRHNRFYATRHCPKPPHALRISVTAAETAKDLEQGLSVVHRFIAGSDSD